MLIASPLEAELVERIREAEPRAEVVFEPDLLPPARYPGDHRGDPEFRRDPNLERAFLDGYGTDPRETDAWHRTQVREAIGTAAWAYAVGAEEFEAQGHRMIAEALSAT